MKTSILLCLLACALAVQLSEPAPVPVPEAKVVQVGGGNSTCHLCESFVSALEPAVKAGNKTIDELAKIADALCHLIAPFKVQKEECDIIIGDIEKIKNMILNGKLPQEICTALGFCAPSQVKQAGGLKGNLTCHLCESFVTGMETAVKAGNKTIDELAKIADALCHLIAPFKVQKEECDTLIGDIEKIKNMILNGKTPQEICTALGFCAPSQVKQAGGLKGNLTCHLCESFVTGMETAVKAGNKTIDELAKIADALCHLIAPFKVQKEECDTLIRDIEKIKNMILNGKTPQEICTALGFCSALASLPVKMVNAAPPQAA